MAISKQMRQILWETTEGHCWYCGKAMIWPTEEIVRAKEYIDSWFVAEHVLPKSCGGKDELTNLLPACRQCNSHKREKSLEEYRLSLAMMSIGITPFTRNQIEYLDECGIKIPLPEPLLFWGEEHGLELIENHVALAGGE